MVGELLERDAELAVLREAAADARSGVGRMVLVEGPAGIGKSSLLALAGDGLPTLRARGAEVERDIPFGAVRQLLERRIVRLDMADRARVLAGAASLAEQVVGGGVPRLDTRDAAAGLRHGLFWAVANLADEAPLALVVDDLQWCDDASLRWLAYLAPRLEEVAALVVVAHRTGERGVPDVILDALRQSARRLTPAQLSAEATGRLLFDAGVQVDEAVIEACHRATSGNPLLVRELGRAVAGRRTDAGDMLRLGGVAIVDRVASQLRGLSPAGAALARAVAVLGPDCALGTAATLADLDDSEAVGAADELVGAGLLASGRSLVFEHPIVATAVAETLGEHERAAHHLRAARVLHAEGADRGRVGGHLLPTEPRGDPWVAERLYEAGEAALTAGASVEAGHLLRRAVLEPPPADSRFAVLGLAGVAAFLVAGDDAERLLREAAELAPAGPDRLAAVYHLAEALSFRGQFADAVRALRAAGEGALDDATRLHAEALGAILEMGQAPKQAAETRLRALLRDAPAELPEARMATGALAYVLTIMGTRPAREVQALLREVTVEDLLGRGSTPTVAAPLVVGATFAAVEDPDGAEALGIELRAVARARGSLLLDRCASVVLASGAMIRGTLHDAEALLRHGAEAGSGGYFERTAQARLARCLTARGATHEALSMIDDDLSAGPGGLASIFCALDVLVEAGQWARAASLANQLEVEVSRRGAAYPSTPWRIAAARAHLGLGDGERARVLIAAQRPITDLWDTPRLHAATLRAEARIVEGDEAVDRLRSAVEHVAGSPSRLELARSLVALGESLRRGGQRVECREPLREGLELAQRCGALPLAERAAAELRATGARARKVLLSGAASLTASELRICRLAAEGLTNREIAQDLWVTRKTVETHLSHAFRKLDVRGRDELSAALDGDQVAPV